MRFVNWASGVWRMYILTGIMASILVESLVVVDARCQQSYDSIQVKKQS